MTEIALIGAGKIGRMVAHFLGGCGDYSLRVLDGKKSALDRVCTRVEAAAGVCCVLDLRLSDRLAKRGFVRMEDVNYEDIIENRFGRYYA